MAAKQESAGDVFDCPICLEKLKVPKYLPCLHTFCEACLQTYIESTAIQIRNKNNSNTSTFAACCPVCRRTVTLNDTDVIVKTWAKHLPLNHLIIPLIETNNKENGVMSKMCKGCERTQELVPAGFWCQQCAEALCEACKSFHPKIKFFTSHEIIPLDMARNSIPDVEEPCPVHHNKVLEVYCFDHRQLCCSVCFATRHRACSDVESLDDVSRYLVSVAGTDSFLGKMSSMIGLVEERIKVKRENVLKIDKQKREITDHVARELDKLRIAIDRLQSVFLKEMGAVHKEQRNKLVSSEQRLEELKKTVQNAYKLFKNVTEKGNQKQIFLMSENIRVQIASHLQEMKSYLESVEHVRIKFTDNEALSKLGLGVSGVRKVGCVATEIWGDIGCSRDLLSSLKDIKKATILNKMVDPSGPLPFSDPFDWTAKYCSVIECDVSTESSVIRGGTFLDNGNLVLIDHRNFMMKIFDESRNLVSVHSFQSKPFDVAGSQNPDKFFVTVGDGKNMRITSWKFTEKLSFGRNFRIPSGVNGIHASCSKQGLVMGSNSSVYLISSVDGTVQKSAVGGNKGGEVGYVAASRKSECFVHIDKSEVVCRDLQMKEKYRYSGILKEPRGLSMDCFDNVYVCDVSPKNMCIIQIHVKENGTVGRRFPIPFQTITKPYNIGFHPDGKTFFVSDFVKPVVEFFELQCK